MSRRSSARTCSITTTCCSTGRTCWPSAAFAAEIGARFDHVLVDEYQDTNRLQASILLALKPDGHGLTVVGDDAQSIYSFRAATVRNILDFPGHFAPPARVVTLGAELSLHPADPRGLECRDRARGRALHQESLVGARSFGAPAAHRGARRGATRRATWSTRVLENREAGLPLKAQAVLFRTSHHSDTLEFELTRRNIPFVKFGGLKFLEAAHVKDMLAALRFAENPRDRVAGFRVTQLVPGIGPASAARILDRLAAPDPGRDARHLCAAARRRRMAQLCRTVRRAVPPRFAAGRPSSSRCAAGTSRISSACMTTRRRAPRISRSSSRSPRAIRTREQFLTDLTLDPPSATLGRSRRAAARRGLSDPLDHPLRQGAGVEIGVRAQRGRRLHSVRSRDRQQPTRSRRSGGCSTWR